MIISSVTVRITMSICGIFTKIRSDGITTNYTQKNKNMGFVIQRRNRDKTNEEDSYMTIKEICDILRSDLYNNGFEYGFILNGQKYKPNMNEGFDKEYYRLSNTIYLVQEPKVTLKEKIGTCIDAVLVMRSILDRLSVSCKIWLLHKKNKMHTILTFSAEDKIVYLELTPQSAKKWYGQEILYSNEQELLQEYKNNGYDISDVTDSIIIGEQPLFLLEKIN